MPEPGLLINATDLQRRLDDPDLRIIDCRFDLMRPSSGRAKWLAAHIPGAVYAHLDNDLAGPITASSGRHPLPAADEAAVMFGNLGVDDSNHVVVYDDSNGAIAARAWWMLRWLGHDRVTMLDGGFAAWMTEQRPVEEGAVEIAAAALSVSPRTASVMTTLELEEIVRQGSDYCLVDARDAARFRGDFEPIDRIPGHIPGAVNLPFNSSVQADGRWKTARELKELWTNVAGGRTRSDWSVMCGSGVTACHLALSARLAGLREPRLYVGSWSEWIREPERPAAMGP